MNRRYLVTRAVVRAAFALLLVSTVALAVIGLATLAWSPCAAAVIGSVR